MFSLWTLAFSVVLSIVLIFSGGSLSGSIVLLFIPLGATLVVSLRHFRDAAFWKYPMKVTSGVFLALGYSSIIYSFYLIATEKPNPGGGLGVIVPAALGYFSAAFGSFIFLVSAAFYERKVKRQSMT